jgi:hypothetical protein
MIETEQQGSVWIVRRPEADLGLPTGPAMYGVILAKLPGWPGLR